MDGFKQYVENLCRRRVYVPGELEPEVPSKSRMVDGFVLDDDGATLEPVPDGPLFLDIGDGRPVRVTAHWAPMGASWTDGDVWFRAVEFDAAWVCAPDGEVVGPQPFPG